MLVLGACATRAPPAPPPAVPGTGPSSVVELAAAIAADSKRSDVEHDSKTRGELAADAGRNADACLALEPQAAACHYGRAIALGLQARWNPLRAGELLNDMIEALARADAADPNYDEAGPQRVRALVLIRAPGWPLGPGDTEAGLAAARRAVALRPHYAPNLLALAEALAKTGDRSGAKQTYVQARETALALQPSADRDEWLQTADQGLKEN